MRAPRRRGGGRPRPRHGGSGASLKHLRGARELVDFGVHGLDYVRVVCVHVGLRNKCPPLLLRRHKHEQGHRHAAYAKNNDEDRHENDQHYVIAALQGSLAVIGLPTSTLSPVAHVVPLHQCFPVRAVVAGIRHAERFQDLKHWPVRESHACEWPTACEGVPPHVAGLAELGTHNGHVVVPTVGRAERRVAALGGPLREVAHGAAVGHLVLQAHAAPT
mmetsp:Transcript_57131/g.178951  ORF Transcript_57131/g.178951 Transcript_57131/m.178951 type:complete len:218 (+) Transcript_57131:62-715(+)